MVDVVVVGAADRVPGDYVGGAVVGVLLVRRPRRRFSWDVGDGDPYARAG